MMMQHRPLAAVGASPVRSTCRSHLLLVFLVYSLWRTARGFVVDVGPTASRVPAAGSAYFLGDRTLSRSNRFPLRSRNKSSSSVIMSAMGFIGLGIMGEGMAARLLTEGVAGATPDAPLVVWNRSTKKCNDLKQRFADKHIEIKPTAREVVEACPVTYSMLSTPEASRAVFEGTDGVLAGVTSGKSIVDCATLAEDDMKRMNDAVSSKGGVFLEAPVSGSKVPAATGQLIFLCAGNKDLFDRIVDGGLKAMGKASHFLGEDVGYGTRAKLVVNSLMGTMMAAYGESLALAESCGLDGNKMVEIIGQGAIQSPMYALKGSKMLAGDHGPNFPLEHAHKDMALASDMAKNAGVKTSVSDEAEKLFRKARKDEKLVQQDFSAVFEEINKESSSDFSKKRRTE